MKKLYSAWFISMALMLGACAQLGLSAPETFTQKLAVGYATVTQVRETATLLLQTQKITSADATNVLTATDVARTGLDTARTLALTNQDSANAKLDSVKAALTALSTYLASRNK